jgi:hypothetical protein
MSANVHPEAVAILCALPILTASLACGWVHEFPWRCPNSSLAVVRATSPPIHERTPRREGEHLPLTPNDLSFSTFGEGAETVILRSDVSDIAE